MSRVVGHVTAVAQYFRRSSSSSLDSNRIESNRNLSKFKIDQTWSSFLQISCLYFCKLFAKNRGERKRECGNEWTLWRRCLNNHWTSKELCCATSASVRPHASACPLSLPLTQLASFNAQQQLMQTSKMLDRWFQKRK